MRHLDKVGSHPVITSRGSLNLLLEIRKCQSFEKNQLDNQLLSVQLSPTARSPRALKVNGTYHGLITALVQFATSPQVFMDVVFPCDSPGGGFLPTVTFPWALLSTGRTHRGRGRTPRARLPHHPPLKIPLSKAAVSLPFRACLVTMSPSCKRRGRREAAERPRRRVPARPVGSAHLALGQALQGLLQPLGALLGRQRQDALGHGAAGPPGTARDHPRPSGTVGPQLRSPKFPPGSARASPGEQFPPPARASRPAALRAAGSSPGSATEAPSHRVGQDGRDLGGSPGPASLLKHSARAHGTGLQPDGSGMSP